MTDAVSHKGTSEKDKTFPKSDKVNVEKCHTITGLVLTLPQTCIYRKIWMNQRNTRLLSLVPRMQTMAERGFVVIAFDESYNGESSGEPRHISSPDIFAEDFSAGVDYLGTRSYVDRNQIGAIGICGSGGFALSAAKVDHRIKAIATASMYDMSRVKRNGWEDSMTDEQRNEYFVQLGEQRWKDFENGSPQLTPTFPAEIPEGLDPITSEFFEYYVAPRGHHPNSIGGLTMTSDLSFMKFPLVIDLESISPRPILFIMGENAHLRYFTEDAYKTAA
ncbi:alpha/beta hydrolase [Halalkalibacter alkalisediminis]|uniref:Alpha/beta hydrolase n=1 Tax=Halalkalibacter alkalisediminis TaxID=935616 RepID=A0ABV6NIC5_9BACI|nr:alpha/beta hydrolase [Halalkalibacter alkalisediminis]